jgi:hypothetical protein
MQTTPQSVFAAPVRHSAFKIRLATFVETVERLPILRPRLVALDLVVLALFLIA